MGELKWCSLCEKEVKPTGMKNNLCPHCNRFVSSKKPEERKRKGEFAMGYSGTVDPGFALRFEQLKKAGVIDNADDVFKQGLMDLEARHLPQGQKQNQEKDKMEELDEMSMDMLMRKMKRDQIQQMMQSTQPEQKSSINMEKLMELMLMEKMLAGGQKDDTQTMLLQEQIRQKEAEMQRYRQDSEMQRYRNEIQELISKMDTKKSSDTEVMARIQDLQNKHEAKMENMRMESQNLRDEKNKIMFQNLMEKLQEKSSTEGWTRQFEEKFMSKAIENLSKQVEKGFSATEEKKGTGEVVGDIISKTAQQLGPVLNAWAQNKAQPQYYEYEMEPPASPQEHSKQQEQRPDPFTPSLNPDEGNAISRLRPDSFSYVPPRQDEDKDNKDGQGTS